MSDASPDPAERADRPAPADPAAPADAADAAASADSASSPRSRRQTFTRWAPLITAAIAIATIAADQLSKLWAEAALSTSERIPLLGDLLGLQLIYNPGAAFSIGEQFTWIFAVLAGLAAIGVGVIAYRTRSLAWSVAWGLLLGGAVTHLADRLFREPGFGIGHVVDFIAYGNWFIGNIADVAIFAGAVLILVLSFLGLRMRPSPSGTSPADDDAMPDA
ncbi:signal peptidase II [Herbiconiux ginsengi]|uniref:Lipoprotein signal peptidase n=1 Tax=Herbiconiux ginsengi TaxID=381665 RepID=A0A1H3KTW8_9MICO|nr:signal peptidase II [Herbiconiux ginsengi]SDY55104.1 signal peptidase II [Herbiconiux ginsengi]